jgi:UDP-2,3-diacylglucosamine pyrophosphatase LpxH
MLIIISDLHFVDGTAGEHDVRWPAFKDVFLADIKALSKHNGAKEIKLLLLGDIIDLLRTTKWLKTDVEDRPWGKNGLEDLINFDPKKGSKTEDHCKCILKDIIARNKETFGFFKNFRRYFKGLKTQLIYIPGNHDRLVNIYPSIRDEVTNELGLTINDSTVDGFSKDNWRFRKFFQDNTYGVFARHGHEFDEFNYDSNDKDSSEGHYQVPVGDIMTTEIAVKIASLLLPALENLPDSHQEDLRRFIFDIDNIRPWTSIPGYLLTKFWNNQIMREAIFCALYTTFKDVSKISFVRRWFFGHPLAVFRLFWDCLKGALNPPMLNSAPEDLYARAASIDYFEKEKNYPFVLYGHTHSSKQVPLDRVKGVDPHYINTGTWRSHISPLLDKSDFVSLKTMTYTVFYRADEHLSEPLGFDTWNGCRSVRGSQRSLGIGLPMN